MRRSDPVSPLLWGLSNPNCTFKSLICCSKSSDVCWKVSVIFDNIFSFYRDKSKEKEDILCQRLEFLWSKYRQTSIRYYIPNTDPMGSTCSQQTSALSFAMPAEKKDLPWNPAAACMTRDTLYWLRKGWTWRNVDMMPEMKRATAVTERQVKSQANIVIWP